MLIVTNLILLYLVLKVLVKALSLLYVKKYLRNRCNASHESLSIADNKKLYIIVPVYEEEDVVLDACAYYDTVILQQNSQINVIFVGNTKEGTDETNPTLNQVKSYFKPKECNRVTTLNVKSRYKSGQLNFAIDHIKNLEPDTSPEDILISIYDVDSKTDLPSILNNFSNIRHDQVVQQYGIYFNNLATLPLKNLKNHIFYEAFFWQTSWTFLFEIRNCLWNSLVTKTLFGKLFKKFSYVIGHGFYFSMKTYEALGEFTTHFQNEDMEYSLKVHSSDVDIVPGSGFSRSDMPICLDDYLQQQIAWSRGPMLALSYHRHNRSIHGQSNLFDAVKLFLHYIYWLFDPLLFYGLALYLIITLNFIAFFFLFALLVLYFYIVFEAPFKSSGVYACDRRPFLRRVPYITLFYAIHCVGPILSLNNIIKEKLLKVDTLKFKTPKQKTDNGL